MKPSEIIDRNIEKGMQEILVSALGVDDDEVKPEAVLHTDLGMEFSYLFDIADIISRISYKFSISANPENLGFTDVANNQCNVHTMTVGMLTAKVKELVQKRLQQNNKSQE